MTRNPIAAFAALLLSTSLPSQMAVAEPTYTTGDLKQLECKVTDAKAVDDYTQVLTVEVHNRGNAAAEPMEFQIELRDRNAKQPRQETWQRVELPRVNRFGRPAPAGGKQTYTVPTGVPGKKAQYAVSVASACWYAGVEVSKPDLHISAPVLVQRKSLAGEFPVTQVELENPFDRALDVLLLVTMTQPSNTVALMGLHLPAGAKRSWVITSRAGTRSYIESDTPPASAVKVTAFQLVDWSLVGAGDADAAAALLRPAYERWYRWTSATTEVSGQFAFRERRLKLNSKTEYDSFTATGRFTLAGTGAPVLQLESGSANAQNEIEDAFRNVRRPDFAALAVTNKFVLVTPDRVEIRGPGWSRPSGGQQSTDGSVGQVGWFPDAQVVSDCIASVGSGDGERTVWTSRDEDRGGYLVLQRRSQSRATIYSYGETDGLIVPQGVVSTTTFGDNLFSASELTLTGLRFDQTGRVQAKAPAGDGAAALRKLWESGYRLPAEPIALTAAFEVTSPGTDWLWRGHKQVKGKVAMTGIGRHRQQIHFTFEGGLAPEMEMGLGAAFRDRLLMWYGRDFNDRPPFDEFFGGATIQAPSADGTFRVDHGRVEEVFTAGGLVRGWKGDREALRFTYEKVDGRMVVTRIEEDTGVGNRSQERWTASVSIRFTKVGELLLPSTLRFERIFGRDWGPETIVLKGLEVR